MAGKMQQTGQTQSMPWDKAQPYILKGLEGAGALYDGKSGFNPFPGSTVAPHSWSTAKGIQTANMGYQPDKALSDTASGAFLASGNPYFTQRLDQQAGALTDDINRGFSAAGRYGSGAHVGALSEGVGNFRLQGLEGDYNRERGLQMQAIGMMDQGRQQALGNMFSAGALDDAYRNATLADKQRVFEGQQQAPWNRLGAFSNILSGQAGQYGTTTQSERTYPVKNALGALIGLGGLFGGFGG